MISCLHSRALPAPQARKVLKTFPGIGNPGADRILLFSRLSPVAAVPSACPHVLVRVLQGPEGDKYVAIYAAAQRYAGYAARHIRLRESGVTC